jgi:succinate dehydrogenase hydrophobic membrane anchor protein
MNANSSGRSGITWLAQRITGVLLAVFLFTHINVNHLTLGEKFIDFSLVNQRLGGSAGWKIFYLLFVPSCVFHAMNGLWGIIADYRPSENVRRMSIAALWLLGFALTWIGADTLINLFTTRGGI